MRLLGLLLSAETVVHGNRLVIPLLASSQDVADVIHIQLHRCSGQEDASVHIGAFLHTLRALLSPADFTMLSSVLSLLQGSKPPHYSPAEAEGREEGAAAPHVRAFVCPQAVYSWYSGEGFGGFNFSC